MVCKLSKKVRGKTIFFVCNILLLNKRTYSRGRTPMIEGIMLAIILVAAVVAVIRPWYRAFSGKSSGCAGCPGGCGYSEHFDHLQDSGQCCDNHVCAMQARFHAGRDDKQQSGSI
jgi:hypothetical protein